MYFFSVGLNPIIKKAEDGFNDSADHERSGISLSLEKGGAGKTCVSSKRAQVSGYQICSGSFMETYEPLPKRSRLIDVENVTASNESHANMKGARIGFSRVNLRYVYPKLGQLKKSKNKDNDKNYKPPYLCQGVLPSNRPRRSIIKKP